MEYTRSGSDQGVAEMEEAAFDPDITRPEEEQKKAGEGTGVSEQSKPKDRVSLFFVQHCCPTIFFFFRGLDSVFSGEVCGIGAG